MTYVNRIARYLVPGFESMANRISKIGNKQELSAAEFQEFSLTATDVAKQLKCSPRTVIRRALQGKIKYATYDLSDDRKAYRFRQQDIDEHIKGRATYHVD